MLIGCTGSIPAEHCANSTDDLDDGADHDQAHGSAHAAGDGGKDLVGGQFLAANLHFFHERTLGKAFNCAYYNRVGTGYGSQPYSIPTRT